MPDSLPTVQKLAQAMQTAWDEFVADTGSLPTEFHIHGPSTTRMSADFIKGDFARMVLAELQSEFPAPAAEPAQAGEDTVWRVESAPDDSWNLVGNQYRVAKGMWQMLDHGTWTRSLWDGLDHMRAEGFVLTPFPAAAAEDGGGER